MIEEAKNAFSKLKDKFLTAGIDIDPEELAAMQRGDKFQPVQQGKTKVDEYKVEFENLPKRRTSRIQMRWIRVIKDSKIP